MNERESLVTDCRLAAMVLANRGGLPTVQGILMEAADEIERLRKKAGENQCK